jgi:hypothetical protein
MSSRTHRLLFMVWGWLALLWVPLGIVAAFRTHPWFGVGVAVLVAVWFLDMGATTCSRCGSYGTGRCGVQSWIVPLLWRRKPLHTVSRFRIRLHYAFDLLILTVGFVAFCFVPVVLPFYGLWLALGWWVVYRSKRFHGLLPLLNAPTSPPDRCLLSLPVISAPL